MKHKIRNFLLLGAGGFLAISSIFMTIEAATTGLEMSRLQKAEIKLSREKIELEERLVRSTSLGDLQEKSTDLGFTKPENLVYITPSEAVAKLP